MGPVSQTNKGVRMGFLKLLLKVPYPQGSKCFYMKGGLGCPPSPPEGKNPNRPPNWDKCAHFSKGHKFLLDRDIDLKLIGYIDQVENIFFFLVNFSIHAQGGARGPQVTFCFSSNLQKIVLSDFDGALHKVPIKMSKLQNIKKLSW